MSRTIIGASNFDILPTQALTYSADDYIEFLEQGGFDTDAGYEWSDLRFLTARNAGKILAQTGLIQVVHESWNENLPWDCGFDLEAFKIATAFPRLDKCYGELDKIQTSAGKKLPIIVHPAGQYLGEVAPKRPRQTQPPGMFSEVWYQLTAEWAVGQGIAIDSDDTAAIAEEILEAEAKAGLDKRVVDIHHILSSRNNHRFKNPGALAVAMVQAPNFAEVQLAIRPDFGGQRSALTAACEGQLIDTKEGEILRVISEAIDPNRQIRVVSEIAATELVAAGYPDITEAHAVINHSIREILG